MFKFAQPFYPLLLAAAKKDPESAHGRMLTTLQQLDRHRESPWGKYVLKHCNHSFCLQNDNLKQTLWGLKFPNVLGLAAGCDKDAIAAGIWSHLGFGFAEMGAVTQHSQLGNPRPRLFRLPADHAALNRLGANNLGATKMAETLQAIWQRQPRNIPIGINLCKSKITPLATVAEDYLASFQVLKDWADYFVINVSSPNTPGLRSLQSQEQLEPILEALQKNNGNRQPILLKISPDLDWEAIANILKVAQDYDLSGIVATNTTTKREGLNTQTLSATGNLISEEAGGISGQPVRQRSTEVIRFIYQQTEGKLPIVGVGGIFTADHAWEKLSAGASLLQLYTGWIYRGPWVVREILTGLLTRLSEKGFSHISEVVGIESKP